MKKAVRLSLGLCLIMLELVLAAPHLASPRLVLRFLPEDVYEAGKDHPAPALPRRILCHLFLFRAGAYMAWAFRKMKEEIQKRKLPFGEAYKRLVTFFLVIKAFDIICLDQILCMSTDYYQRCYPETRGCAGWKDRGRNSKNQALRLALYPVLCAVPASCITKKYPAAQGGKEESE
ncbi:MAG: hypothetical protein ACSW8K_02345 [bacterium]